MTKHGAAELHEFLWRVRRDILMLEKLKATKLQALHDEVTRELQLEGVDWSKMGLTDTIRVVHHLKGGTRTEEDPKQRGSIEERVAALERAQHNADPGEVPIPPYD